MVKVGLEIHQQLDTGKLFCNCPSVISDGNPDFILKRRLRISKGETGETDEAAQLEVSKEKEFHYQCYHESTCLVEMDEEPPHSMNPNALNLVLNVAKMLNCRILDRIQVMRKTVLDGSNTSGFQRTALVAVDGHIDFEGKRVGIPSVCIEEDAAKIVEKTYSFDVYNLSRLGIPLIEIATAPDITSGDMCRKVAEHLGMILRSTGGVKRGLGTIRQDVNVSIPEGARVEIKGAQELKMLGELVDMEALRQKNLTQLKLKAPSKLVIVDVTKVFAKTECIIIKNSIRVNGKVLGICLPGMLGLLGKELQPGRRVGTELSDYAKVHAGISGLFHSDELPKYGVSEDEVTGVRKGLLCAKGDAFVIISERAKEKAERALSAVYERLRMLSKGVPEEVRKASPEGTTSYMRPMPGGARMYPETDLGLIKPELKGIKPPKMLSELAKELETKHKLSQDLAKLTVRSLQVEFIMGLIERFSNVKPGFIAETVLSAERVIKKEFNKELKISETVYEKIFGLLHSGTISKDVVLELLSKTDKKAVEELAKDYAGVDQKNLEEEVKIAVMNNNGASFNALMGIIMGRFKGKASGSQVSELLKKYMK